MVTMELVHSRPVRRATARAAAIFGAIALGLFALSAFSATPPGNATPVIWGTLADASTSTLLDSGTQTSMFFPNPAGVDAIVCVSTDAGTNAALGTITLLGSNDGTLAHSVVLGSAQILPAPSGVIAWDPINSGVAFYALQADGGGTVAGAVSCSLNNTGGQP